MDADAKFIDVMSGQIRAILHKHDRMWADLVSRFFGTMIRMTNLFLNANGRPPEVGADMCRAAIVYLHAALEEVLREAARLQISTCQPGALAKVPLSMGDKREKQQFGLSDLAEFRGLTVLDVLEQSFDDYLSTRSFSKAGQIAAWLKEFRIPVETFDRHASSIQGLLERRHRIVHRADCASGCNPDPWTGADLERAQEWISAVTRLGANILLHLAPSGAPSHLIKMLDNPPNLVAVILNKEADANPVTE